MKLKELRDKLQKTLLDARAICEKAEQEKRDFTPEEREQVKGLMTEAGNLKGQIKAAEDDEALRKSVLDLGAEFGMKDGQDEPQDRQRPGRGKSVGERFVEAEAYKRWLAQVAPGGHIPESAKGLMSPPVEFKTLLTGASDTSGGAFVQTDYTGIYEPLGRRPLVLRDLISPRTTQSDLVEFVRQTAKVTQAAPTAEATATAVEAGGGTKPEGAMAFEKVTAAVKTIAVWIPATKRALSDASQLRGLIDQELRADLEEDLEDEIVAGDGSGEHFTGLLETEGILSQAWDTDALTTIRKARTALAVTGRARPTGLLVHPNDAEMLDLLKDNDGRFYFGGPGEGGVQRAWRVPVVECEAMTEGTGLMGDFRKAVLWDRERATVQVSDSHSDFFVRNMVAVLAEMRAAFGVIRPSAFITVDLAVGS
jgi:HK97 family phage major capsid protein